MGLDLHQNWPNPFNPSTTLQFEITRPGPVELTVYDAAGRAVVAISDDLEEIFALADRIVVMYEGRVVGDLLATETSVADVGLLMAGAQVEAA